MASCRRRVVPIVVGGIGLLTDFYDFSVINLVRPILDDLYPGASASYDSMVTASSIVGSACGMLVLGALADVLGRRRLLLVSGGLDRELLVWPFLGHRACLRDAAVVAGVLAIASSRAFSKLGR